MLNQQKPEARTASDKIDLHSIFYTLQGEGPFTGRRAVFIRLAGCNLQCPQCDTEYTTGRHEATVSQVVQYAQNNIPFEVRSQKTKRMLAVITGGEPLRQEIGHLVSSLLSAGFLVQIESNGVFAPDERLTVLLETVPALVKLVISAKTRRIHAECHRLASAFKYVLASDNVDPEDGLPLQALQHKATPCIARPGAEFFGEIYLNPADEKDEKKNLANLAAVAESCMKHGYLAGVQLHKYMDLA